MEVFGLQSEVIINGIKYNVMIDDELDTNSVFSEEEGISAYDSYIGDFEGNLYSMTEEEVANEIRALLSNNKQ